MNFDSYALFESQLSEACDRFPNLRIKKSCGFKFLKGTIDVKNDEQKTVRSFLIEIHCSKEFPYRYPLLYEIGGDIPSHPDWHKYNDNLCCVTVEPEEILHCKNGIVLHQFISMYAIPYLANQCHKILFGNYINEYPHGIAAYEMFYTNLMGTHNKSMWVEYFKYAFDLKKPHLGRNDLCMCKSGNKFKKCHLICFLKLREIGEKNVLKHFVDIRNAS